MFLRPVGQMRVESVTYGTRESYDMGEVQHTHTHTSFYIFSLRQRTIRITEPVSLVDVTQHSFTLDTDLKGGRKQDG